MKIPKNILKQSHKKKFQYKTTKINILESSIRINNLYMDNYLFNVLCKEMGYVKWYV